MRFKKRRLLICLLTGILFIIPGNIYSLVMDFQLMNIEEVSRYNEDRIAFQHVQETDMENDDNSISGLMIIRDNQVYLFRDGYDDSKRIKLEIYIAELRRELQKDLWVNKINSKPDYVKIADRRTEKLLNVKEDFVEKNFGDFYRSVRNSHINKHVKIFYELMRDRIESGLYLERKPITPPPFQEMNEPAKYSISITGKSVNDYIYFAEDSDGDGVTETFYVTTNDGFNWGYRSGPNIIFIFNNKEEDIKQLIGGLCNSAYYGTPEEEENILKTFPKDTEIIEEFKLDKVSVQASK